MFDIFGWVRNGAKQAFLAGLADAVKEVSGNRVDDGAEALTIQLALPAPAPEPEEGVAEKNGKKHKVRS